MIARFLHQNPRILLLLIGLIAVAGVSSFLVMPRLEDPVLGKRVAVVSTIFPGADAQRVDSLVTQRLEQQLEGISEIGELRSNSREGISNIILKLADRVEQVDSAWSQVRDRLNDAELTLPDGCQQPSFEVFPLKAYAVIVGVKWQDRDRPI